jgi:hypothetical protein
LRKNRTLLSAALLLIFVAVASAEAQTPATTATVQKLDATGNLKRVLGEVTAIDLGQGQLTVKTMTGAEVTVKLDEKTLYRRIPPGETTLDKAVGIKVSDISAGDHVLARGPLAESSVLAREVIVVSHKDIAEKHAHDREAWIKRGLTGLVTALDPEKKQITVSAHSPAGEHPIIINTGEKVAFRRYSPESIRYSDSQASSFAELKVGDQLRALGDRSTDGTQFTAEEVVSGTFRTVVGKITGINVQTGEVAISNIQTKQALSILVNKDSRLHRLSPEVGQLLIQRLSRGAAGTGQPSTGNGAGNPATGAGQGSADLQGMIEKLPAVTLAELKPGDALLVSTTIGNNPARATAILLTVGADDIVKLLSQPSARRKLNLELGLPSGVDP